MKICFIDVETTGINSAKDRIRQLAGCVRENGKVRTKFNIKSRSEKIIYEKFKKILDSSVNKYDSSDKMFFIAYNAKFDSDFIRDMFLRNDDQFFGSYFYNPYICLMQLAARYFMKNNRLKKPDNFKLSTVCKYFKIPVNEKRLHDGHYDIEISRKLYNKLAKKV